ncbi:hypothetical protein EGW08_008690, partial [Elysia chlorotica]
VFLRLARPLTKWTTSPLARRRASPEGVLRAGDPDPQREPAPPRRLRPAPERRADGHSAAVGGLPDPPEGAVALRGQVPRDANRPEHRHEVGAQPRHLRPGRAVPPVVPRVAVLRLRRGARGAEGRPLHPDGVEELHGDWGGPRAGQRRASHLRGLLLPPWERPGRVQRQRAAPVARPAAQQPEDRGRRAAERLQEQEQLKVKVKVTG